MPKLARLYLDTARLGLMSASAQLAARDFARLAGEGVSTLYFQNVLRGGSPLADGSPPRLHHCRSRHSPSSKRSANARPRRRTLTPPSLFAR
jgi:hypothetical protein